MTDLSGKVLWCDEFHTLDLIQLGPWKLTGTAVLLLSPYGVAKEVAINAFFMHFVVILLIPGIVGSFFIAKRKGSTLLRKSNVSEGTE